MSLETQDQIESRPRKRPAARALLWAAAAVMWWIKGGPKARGALIKAGAPMIVAGLAIWMMPAAIWMVAASFSALSAWAWMGAGVAHGTLKAGPEDSWEKLWEKSKETLGSLAWVWAALFAAFALGFELIGSISGLSEWMELTARSMSATVSKTEAMEALAQKERLGAGPLWGALGIWAISGAALGAMAAAQAALESGSKGFMRRWRDRLLAAPGALWLHGMWGAAGVMLTLTLPIAGLLAGLWFLAGRRMAEDLEPEPSSGQTEAPSA